MDAWRASGRDRADDDDFDAALGDARAIAAASGNGATLVFGPRTRNAQASPGFTLRVYQRAPRPRRERHADDRDALDSDAAVSEKTLGSPPFAIFIGASGHVSGAPAYPHSTIVQQPVSHRSSWNPRAPRADSFSPSRRRQSPPKRTLACAVTPPGGPAAESLARRRIFRPSRRVDWSTTGRPIRDSVVATEWGYTHWFAATAALRAAPVRRFPNVLPSPYTPAYSQPKPKRRPRRLHMTPYSYPNSLGGSMNDAPATFPLDPSNDGICAATSPTITDNGGAAFK